MADHLSKGQRSWNMSRIGSKHTKPELMVRSLLHRMGFRFRLHQKILPGTPDIVLKKYGVVIFCHGCFWHHHEGCKRATIPKTNRNYWLKKFKKNSLRFELAKRELSKLGWKVIVVWECETKNPSELKKKLFKEVRGG